MHAIRLLDYFFILRPIVFFPGWTTTIAAFILSSQITAPQYLPPPNLMLVLLSSAMIMGCGFIVNQLSDVETDRINQKLFLLSEGFLPRKAAWTEAVLMAAGGVAVSSLISPTMTILHAAGLSLIPLYNWRPFEFKNKTMGSLVTNALMGSFAFAFGWFLTDQPFGGSVMALLPFLCLNTSLYLLTTIPDAGGDSKTQKQTFPVVYGVPSTLRVALTFSLLALLFATFARAWVLLIPGFVLFIMLVWNIRRADDASVPLTLKWTLFVFSVVVCFYFPSYLVLIMMSFALSRYYYKKRFGLDYPSFRA